MTREAFDDLLRDVPDRVRLPPAVAWAGARRRRRRRRAVVAGLLATALLGVAVALANIRGAERAEPAPSPGTTFVRAVSDGDTWKVTRSDGTTLTLDPKVDAPGAKFGLSPDGRWLSYAQGPESGGVLRLYRLRSDQIKPRAVEAVPLALGFAHQWSPDSKLVLVPVPDGDSYVLDTAGRLISNRSELGATAGFVDDESPGWITPQWSPAGFTGLAWNVTDLEVALQRSLPLQVGPGILRSPHWPALGVEQASLSPDGSRVAALLTNYRGQARILVFSTTDGALIARQDTTKSKLQFHCPFRWESGTAQLPRPGEDCAVEPN